MKRLLLLLPFLLLPALAVAQTEADPLDTPTEGEVVVEGYAFTAPVNGSLGATVSERHETLAGAYVRLVVVARLSTGEVVALTPCNDTTPCAAITVDASGALADAEVSDALTLSAP